VADERHSTEGPATPLRGIDGGGAAEQGLLETAVFEIKRVIAGQDEMLERVFVCLLAGGHLLIEGVPGLAKTLTVKTVADVFGGKFERIQFTPDLVPADLVGTRMYRQRSERFDIELGPVFCNFLLADEINRAPAKVQSALLEVMQERQVTIGKETYPVGTPFLVMATQNPIESEGTYPLPEAQVDRFMLKIVVDYPHEDDELTVIERALLDPVAVEQLVSVEELAELQLSTRRVYVDPAVSRYALRIALATRRLAEFGLGELAEYVSYGASPRGPINLVLGARALAVLRGRRYALPQDVRELAKDVLRHRMVLSYEALAEGIEADAILDRVLEAIEMPQLDLARGAAA
jgi:MoxR-like ATPase